MKLLVFDIDGTLTNSVTPHINTFIKVLHQMGVEEIDTDFKSYKHHTDSYISKAIFEKDRKERFTKKHQNTFERELMKGIKEYAIPEIKGATLALKLLCDRKDLAICYATGSMRIPAEFKLNLLNVNYNKNAMVASNNLLSREEIVLKAINNAKDIYQVKEFEKIISVGDGLWDLKTAQNLNLDFIGIGNENKAVLLENGAEVVCENMTDFMKIIDNFLN